jgi:peptidase A4-like protein
MALKTRPNARCAIRPADEERDFRRWLTLYADPQGLIRFFVHPASEHDEPARFVVDCESEDGAFHEYPLELRLSPTPSDEMPAPPSPHAKGRRSGATLRPPLSREELLHLSEDELLERHYPLRPDPDEAPDAFNTWRRAVSTPSTYVEPHLVSNPDITHGTAIVEAGPETSFNWSGIELRGVNGYYDFVSGTWHVPPVTGVSYAKSYSAFWIGLDGDGTNDLVQCGTEQDNMTYYTDAKEYKDVKQVSISTYYAWTEFLPQQPTEQQITNLPVSPGDEIFAEVWIGEVWSRPFLGGGYGSFFLENLTTSEHTYVFTPVGATAVGGSEAEWIMERPTVGGQLPALANYGSASMSHAYARRAGSSGRKGFVPYHGAETMHLTMMNTTRANTLATATPINTQSIQFDWVNYL